jgi:hypothetical protein
MLHPSRGAYASEVCQFPPTQREGAERRQALGCSGTRRRASNAGPQGEIARPCIPSPTSFRSQRIRGMLASRRSTAGGFLAPSPPWRNLWALHMSGALQSRMGAFARSARSGGWAVLPGRLPGARLRAVHAGRRIPLRLWLVSGDALGERDDRKVVIGRCRSILADRFVHRSDDSGTPTIDFARCNRRCRHAGYPQDVNGFFEALRLLPAKADIDDGFPFNLR